MKPSCSNCSSWRVSDYWQYWGQNKKEGIYGLCEAASGEDNGLADCICDGEGIGGQLITHESFNCAAYKVTNEDSNNTAAVAKE